MLGIWTTSSDITSYSVLEVLDHAVSRELLSSSEGVHCFRVRQYVCSGRHVVVSRLSFELFSLERHES